MAGQYLPSMFRRDQSGLGSLLREIENTFDDFSRRSPLAGFYGAGNGMTEPNIDVAEGKDVTAELPGVEEGDIEVTLADDMLTIRGEKKTERDERGKDKNWLLVERSYGLLQPDHRAALRTRIQECRSEARQGFAANPPTQARRNRQEGKEDRDPQGLRPHAAVTPAGDSRLTGATFAGVPTRPARSRLESEQGE